MPLHRRPSRRQFIAASTAGCAALSLPLGLRAAGAPSAPPLVDLHVHLDNSSLDQILPLGVERGVRFGIVEHAGTEENVYPVVLSSDAELNAYLDVLDGKGVYKGIQTEWTGWMKCFSKRALSRLDYVLTDAMTYPGTDGRRVKLWEKDAPQRVNMSDRQKFMDAYVDWYVRILEEQPIDVLANVSWLPEPLASDHDTMWTDRRTARVLDAAKRHTVAIEISSSFRLPKPRFLRMVKEAGLKFTYGSNGRYPKMGLLEYSTAMAKELGLTQGDLFVPGQIKKAVERCTF
jgi:hypothetical protein